MEKSEKHCSNCNTKYSVSWDEEKTDMEPWTCPFCGYEVEDALDGEPDIPEEAEHDSWN